MLKLLSDRAERESRSHALFPGRSRLAVESRSSLGPLPWNATNLETSISS